MTYLTVLSNIWGLGRINDFKLVRSIFGKILRKLEILLGGFSGLTRVNLKKTWEGGERLGLKGMLTNQNHEVRTVLWSSSEGANIACSSQLNIKLYLFSLNTIFHDKTSWKIIYKWLNCTFTVESLLAVTKWSSLWGDQSSPCILDVCPAM